MKKVIFICLIISLLVISACGEQTITEETIDVGFVGPLTGEAASWGEDAVAGITLAMNEFNEGRIDGKKINLIAEDDTCSQKGVNAVTKLINVDNVVGLLGPICSSSAGPAVPIAQERGVPVIMITASAPALTTVGDYIFRVYPSDTFQGEEGADVVYNTLGKTKAAVLYVKNDWGEGLKTTFMNNFKELGGSVVYEMGVLQTDKDFKTELVKIKESGADVVYAPIFPANAVTMFKQAEEMGLEIPIVGGDALDGEEVVQSGYGNGVIYTVPQANLPEEFKQRIKALPGFEDSQVGIAAPLSYDAAKIMFAAIEEAGTNRVAIRDAIAKTSYKGVSNPFIEFDEIGDLTSAVYDIKIIQNKEAVMYK